MFDDYRTVLLLPYLESSYFIFISAHPATINEIAKRQLSLKSPLMPTSCTTTLGTDVVNLHYSLPPESECSEIALNINNQQIPISLTPVVQNTKPETGYIQIPATMPAELVQWSPPIVGGDLTSATPPMTYIPHELTTPQEQHRLSEEEFYGEDAINSNLDMALYSPLPHLQFTGSHAPTVSTPLEDWIKQPTTLTLSSDALMASFSTSESPTTTVLTEQTLPSFSQGLTLTQSNNIEGLYSSSENGFALPPLENTLNFENVDLKDLPS